MTRLAPQSTATLRVPTPFEPGLSPEPARELLVADLGTMSFADALAKQREAARQRASGELAQDLLFLVEHPHVISLGRRSEARHLITSPVQLAAQGIELHEVERGGDVTYHGPGQLVGYPVFDLKRHRRDLHWYLRQIEESLIVVLRRFDLRGQRRDGYTGVWIDDRKIASIGVHARDWVTWHGFALNVSTDLSYFDLIVPCGIRGVRMTSIQRELPATVGATLPEVRDAVTSAFASVFQFEAVRTLALECATGEACHQGGTEDDRASPFCGESRTTANHRDPDDAALGTD